MNKRIIGLRSHVARAVTALVMFAALGWGAGQAFDANRYYQQCLRFEAGGDLGIAKESCTNATRPNPDFTEAKLALGRVELALGELGSAESRLNRLRDETTSAEPFVLLADLAIQTDRLLEAEAFLATAQNRLTTEFNRELAARTSYLQGVVAEQRGRFSEALTFYEQAVVADSIESKYRLADASLRFKLGNLDGAREQLESYLALSDDIRNADLRELMGLIRWSSSDLEGAAEEFEAALGERRSRETEAQSRDLRNLSLIYFGLGDFDRGSQALREASRRGNLLTFLFSNTLLWLLLLLLLVATHLVGESRIANSTTLEVLEGPQLWSVGQLYGILFTSVIVSLAAAVAYSLIAFNNALAIMTPLQDTEVRAVLLITFSLMATLLTVRRVQQNGWDAFEKLLGSAEQAFLGIVIGLVLVAAMLAYLAFRPEAVWLGDFFLDLSRLTPLVIVAMVLLPLSELLFRAFAYPTLMNRYDRSIGLIISGGLSALVLVTPVVLLYIFGLVLSEMFRRRNNGMTVVVTQLVFYLGLVLVVAFIPWARSLFVF